jgi:hypothetical protein
METQAHTADVSMEFREFFQTATIFSITKLWKHRGHNFLFLLENSGNLGQ